MQQFRYLSVTDADNNTSLYMFYLSDCGDWHSDTISDNHLAIIYINATTFGSEAVMTCNPGYHVFNKTNTRSESAVCTENGTWSTLTCSACVLIGQLSLESMLISTVIHTSCDF